MAHLDIRGARFEYAEKGDGAPLVLVHGSASDYRTWEHQHEELARHFRTIVYSRRYHWPNEPIAEDVDYSMLEHVEDLGALVEALDAEPAPLVGHSYGACLCLLLAIREPGLALRPLWGGNARRVTPRATSNSSANSARAAWGSSTAPVSPVWTATWR